MPWAASAARGRLLCGPFIAATPWSRASHVTLRPNRPAHVSCCVITTLVPVQCQCSTNILKNPYHDQTTQAHGGPLMKNNRLMPSDENIYRQLVLYWYYLDHLNQTPEAFP